MRSLGRCQLLVAATVLLASTNARAFCRTTTVPIPADFRPTETQCWTQGLPLYWKNACVGYDLQKNASRYVTLQQAESAIATAFSQWTGAECTPSHPSIAVNDLGPVDCNRVQYNMSSGNQNVIIFRDDDWPYHDINNTLALTTVTFDSDTGEIYDADMEINTAQHVPTVADPIPRNGYDFLSIVTHETGHFLGLAHSGDTNATMYAHYTLGSTNMRNLTSDDTSGICTIYRPDRTRTAANNALAAEGPCDPTPRHGFSSQCGPSDTTAMGCTPSCGAGASPGSGWAAGGIGLGLVVLYRRRRRRRTWF
jgi:MYXO-CTERM domain-containing protein